MDGILVICNTLFDRAPEKERRLEHPNVLLRDGEPDNGPGRVALEAPVRDRGTGFLAVDLLRRVYDDLIRVDG